MPDISSAQHRELCSRAHTLVPVVLIGGSGLTPSVVVEIERNLLAHGLIKIRAASAERAERDAMLASICEQTGAASVQHIGKTLVIYRPSPKKAEPPGRPARTSGYSADANKRLSSGRPGSSTRTVARSPGGRTDDKPGAGSRTAAKKRPAKARPTTRR